MTITVTGIQFYRLVNANGWQLAVALMRINNHPSRIWEWSQNLQMFEYTAAQSFFERRDSV